MSTLLYYIALLTVATVGGAAFGMLVTGSWTPTGDAVTPREQPTISLRCVKHAAKHVKRADLVQNQYVVCGDVRIVP